MTAGLPSFRLHRTPIQVSRQRIEHATRARHTNHAGRAASADLILAVWVGGPASGSRGRRQLTLPVSSGHVSPNRSDPVAIYTTNEGDDPRNINVRMLCPRFRHYFQPPSRYITRHSYSLGLL